MGRISLLWAGVLLLAFIATESTDARVCRTNLDIGFVLDASGSVRANRFKMCLNFINKLVNSFHIGPHNTRIGIVRYSTRPSGIFRFTSYRNKHSTKHRVNRIRYTGGWTRTGAAINYARRYLYQHNRRRGVRKVLIVMTDGKSQDSVVGASRSVKRMGIEVFAIGIGRGYRRSELNQMATDRNHVLTARFRDLHKIIGKIKYRACKGPGRPPRRPSAKKRVYITTHLTAISIGCFRDTGRRAIPPMEGKSKLLKGSYPRRRYAIQKCALVAARRGWRVFAVQNGGWCATSSRAHLTYRRYGEYNRCRKDGEGGPWANQVYKLHGSCRKRTTKGNCCVFPFVYRGKRHNSCTRARHNRPWCAMTPNYDVDKLWGNCAGGAARPFFVTPSVRVEHLGCWRDTGRRAIPQLDGKFALIRGNYQRRRNAIRRCALVAARLGYRVFGVQNGGWCASGPRAQHTYRKYGKSNRCRNGKGGPWANDVYMISGKCRKRTTKGDCCALPFVYRGRRYSSCTRVNSKRGPWCSLTNNYDKDRKWGYCRGYRPKPRPRPPPRPVRPAQYSYIHPFTHVGCYRDKASRALSKYLGHYKRNAIQKCYSQAQRRGWRMFSVQAGGYCFSGPNAHVTYRKYGNHNTCRNYKGGHWANSVYSINTVMPPKRWHGKPFGWLGCYRDRHVRALPVLLGRFRGRNAVMRCYHQANRRGYRVFSMQAHNECRSGPKAHTSYSMYGRRGGCSHGTGGGWRNDVYAILSRVGIPRPALGMQSRKIPNNAIRASSQWDRNHGPERARLHIRKGRGKTGAWSARRNNRHQWIQIDLRSRAVIKLIATQGRQDLDQWVESYDIFYSNGGRKFKKYPRRFAGNYDRHTVVTRVLRPRIYCRFIRFYPKDWYGHISMRIELYGKRFGGALPLPAPLPRPLPTHYIYHYTRVGCFNDRGRRALPHYFGRFSKGAIHKCFNLAYKKGYRMFSIQAGGYCFSGRNAYDTFNSYGPSTRCRRNLGGPWANDVYSISALVPPRPWHGKKFGHVGCYRDKHIRALPLLLGRFRGRGAVERCYRKANRRGFRVFSMQAHNECRSGPTAHISYSVYNRREVCSQGMGGGWANDVYVILRRAGTPRHELGIGNRKVRDSAIIASSQFDGNHRASLARLRSRQRGHLKGAWSARLNNRYQWIQVDLTRRALVRIIATQGRQDYDQWVKSYTLGYSNDGRHFKRYPRVFPGNFDRNTLAVRVLRPRIFARFVRIYPRSWHGHISMRFELYGRRTARPRPRPRPRPTHFVYHYRNIGCFRDTGRRALPVVLGTFYGKKDAVRQCFNLAFRRGYRMFALQNGGHCFSGPEVYATYRKYGEYNKCRNYRGGPWANDVYTINMAYPPKSWHGKPFGWLGCYRDRHIRALPVLLGRYRGRNAVMRCYHQANRRGYRVFSMQANNECRSGPTAHSSYSAWGRRGGCSHWTGGNWANDVYLIRKRAGIARPALGMESRKIPNNAISASSQWDPNHGPERARLHIRSGRGKTGAWSARHNNRRQWIQIDLRSTAIVRIIATQGRQDHKQWVESYKVSYGVIAKNWKTIGKVFTGNTDQHTVVYRVFRPRIIARYVRINPRNWYKHISMRIELYGKRIGGGRPGPLPRPPNTAYIHHYTNIGCFQDNGRRALSHHLGNFYGKSNVIAICYRLASRRGYKMFSVQNGGQCFSGGNAHATFRKYGKSSSCRHYKGGPWANDVYSIKPLLPPGKWHGKPFGWIGCYRDKHVRALPVLLGRFRGRNAVMRCYHQANRRGYRVFSMQAHNECRSGPKAHTSYSMYRRRGGCSHGTGGNWANDVYVILRRAGVPRSPLGMENKRIPNRAIKASSAYDNNHAPYLARLHARHRGHRQPAWSARTNNNHQWLQIDLGAKAVINAIATQGRHNFDQWVTSYRLSYGNNGRHFKAYRPFGRFKVFAGNYDRTTVVPRILRPPIFARYVRIHPKSWFGHISMRVELYGRRRGGGNNKNVCSLPLRPGRCRARMVMWFYNKRTGRCQTFNYGGCGGNGNRFRSRRQCQRRCVKGGPQSTRYNHHINFMGCFRDRHVRALPAYLGNFKGKNSVITCFRKAYARGFRVFGVQAGGHCFSGKYAANTYSKYGKHNQCRNYKGGHWASDVYRISPVLPTKRWHAKPFGFLGCYRDTGVRALPVLLGRFRGRNAVQRCYHQANRRGYRVFSMQAHIECWSGPTAHVTYSMYGRRGGCSHWTGGNWANDVYIILSKAGIFRKALGMQNGRIPNNAIRASSQWDRNHGPERARLHIRKRRGKTGAWSARHNNRRQWIQIDLRRKANVWLIATQGRQDYPQWVTTYTVSFGNNGRHWRPYNIGRHTKIFSGNFDQNTVVYRALRPAIHARFIRIHPLTWVNHISMRIELYGRRVGRPAPPPVPRPPPTIRATTGVRVRDIGCYRDTGARAIPQMDGRDVILKDYYRRRADAIKKCALVALRYGYKVFAVQHGGWCATGKNAHRTYAKYGKSNRCRNGKGGPWANTVYRVHGKCRQKSNDGHCCSFPFIYRGRRYNSCTKAGRRDRRPWCSLTPNYDRDRKFGFCGGFGIPVTRGLNAVRIGCFRDTGRRAIPPMEGKSKLLKGSYPRRRYAIQKCALVAARRGWRIFAVQNGGWCATSSRAHLTYKRYGPYNRCRKDGKGGPWANQVYKLKGSCRIRTTKNNCCVFPFVYRGKRYNSCTRARHNRPWCAITPNYDVDKLWGNCAGGRAPPRKITPSVTIEHLGCWRDTGRRAIPQLDGKFALIRGNYQRRRNAIRRCALVAARLGYRVFGVQNGGWCASGPRAQHTYRKYGKSNRCRNGKGGPWANDVYRVSGTCKQRTTKSECCVFPFIYKGRRYNACTRRNSKRGPWCSLTNNYDKDRKWGYCRGYPPKPKPPPRPRPTQYIYRYSIVGCFRDTGKRALPKLLGTFYGKKEAVKICYRLAYRSGYRVFSVQNGGQCFSGRFAHSTYDLYGRSRNCRNFKGGPWANDVYSIRLVQPPKRWHGKPFGWLGCYRDTGVRALPVLLGRFRGRNAVMRCYHQANRRGYKVFSMQAHNACRSGPKAHTSYSMYGRRGGCSHWTGGGWRNDVYMILKRGGKPRRPLGMENKRIPNGAIRVSSQWDRNHGPANARLNKRKQGRRIGAWSSRAINLKQWIQVDFRRLTTVRWIATQGRHDLDQWVKSYRVEFGNDGRRFWPYRQGRRIKVFAGNFDRNTVVTRLFKPAIRARFIRINPRSWYHHISMRLEFYGRRFGRPRPSPPPRPIPCPMPRPPPRKSQYIRHYTILGCFRDKAHRAITRLLGVFYGKSDAVHRCYKLAARRGYKMFAVQNGGQCFSGPRAHVTYRKYGRYDKCRNFKGGPWANNVYTINTLQPPKQWHGKPFGWLGCYRDRHVRALPVLLGRFRGRNAVMRCYHQANRRGYRVFSMQAHNACRSGPKAHTSYSMYGRRGGCSHWTGGGWRNDVYVILSRVGIPRPALGMQSRKIPNNAIRASSQWDRNHGPERARLHIRRGRGKTGAWSARRNNRYQWIQIDLRSRAVIKLIATQGRQDLDQWVESYDIFYSNNGRNFKRYPRIFAGNFDRHTVVTRIIRPAIRARFIRIHPRNWYGHISMRIELYGKRGRPGVIPKPRPKPSCYIYRFSFVGCFNDRRSRALRTYLGFKRGKDAAQQCYNAAVKRGFRMFSLQAGGHCFSGHNAHATYRKYGRSRKCRNYKGGHWANDVYSINIMLVPGRWFNKPFGFLGCYRDTGVRALPVLLGRYRGRNAVMRCYHQANRRGYRVFSMQAHNECRSGPTAHVTYSMYGRRGGCSHWTGGNWANDVYVILSRAGVRRQPLGMQNRRIPSISIRASSQWDRNHAPAFARLHQRRTGHRIGAWSAKRNNRNQWLQIDLRRKTRVSLISTQGRQDLNQWVTSYRLSYGNNGRRFYPYKIRGRSRIFAGNYDRNTVVTRVLQPVIRARFIRIHPLTWFKHVSMRVELYGRPIGGFPPRPVPRPPPSVRVTTGVKVRDIGCYRDTGARAIPQMDGRDVILKDYYRRRADAIKKCALVALRYGYKVFAVQHGGWCATGKNAHRTYAKYGKSNRCRNGKGGPWANTVYRVHGKCRQKTNDGHCCSFPFIYRGRRYNSCTKAGRRDRRPWCSLTPNYDRDRKFGFCGGLRVHISKGLKAISIGCFRDTGRRAIPPMEGKSKLLKGSYPRRRYAIQKCALVAARRGWRVFAVQNGGWCATSSRAYLTYKRYGKYNRCKKDGKGGPWANQVYRLKGSCRIRTTKNNCCVFPFVYRGKRYNSCTRARHNRPWCAITPNYDVDKLWGNCAGGRAPPRKITPSVTIQHLGCWRDTGRRAIPQLDGKFALIRGNYQRRRNAIRRCALVAARLGYRVFGVQNGGWCASGPRAQHTYRKYGKSNKCRNGKGGPWANDVYRVSGTCKQRTTKGECCVFPFIYKGRRYNACTRRNSKRGPWCSLTNNYDKDRKWGYCRGYPPKPKPPPRPKPRPNTPIYHYTIVGCYKDKSRRAMGKHIASFHGKKNAVHRCFRLARARGYKMFSLQAGGQCFTGPDAHVTYRRYGRSSKCRGYKGGNWANDVYSINIVLPPKRWKRKPVGWLGCFRDTSVRALPILLGRFRGRNAVMRCYHQANRRGYRVFSMQAHNDCLSGPTAHVTYSMYGRRGRCSHWTGGNWANDVYVILSRVGVRDQAIGMQSRYIPDRSIRASSQWDRNHGPERARLHIRKGRGKTGAWSARHNNRRQWIQIDLRRRYVITMISTQGRQDYNQWVESYRVMYGNSPRRLRLYKRGKAFAGNYDRHTVVTRVFRPAIRARFIRIQPLKWYSHVSMRTELYGKPIKPPKPVPPKPGPRPLPPIRKTHYIHHYTIIGCYRDTRKRALSRYFGNFKGKRDAVERCFRIAQHRGYRMFSVQAGGYCFSGPNAHANYNRYGRSRNCRGYKGGSWANDVYAINTLLPPRRWKGKPFGFLGCYRDTRVRALPVLLGRFRGRNAVQRCYHQANRRGYKVFSMQAHNECRSGPKAHTSYSMYGRRGGCSHWTGGSWANDVYVILRRAGNPVPAFGMANKRISNKAIRASSQWDRNHGPERARLHIRKRRGKIGAWSARHNNRRQWIQIDLRRRSHVLMISTQGRQDLAQWVTSYTISYSNTGKRFNTYRTRQGVRVFVGNYDKNTVVTRVLRPIIKARFIRINPRTWYRHISMRLELYGRNIGIILPPRPPPLRSPYVYRFSIVGCFRDKRRRALPRYFGHFHGKNAVKQCYKRAIRYGYRMFGVQAGGQCFSGGKAHIRYRKYGRSRKCRNYKGGIWANDVYSIRLVLPPKRWHGKPFGWLGCYRDMHVRALPVLLGRFRGRNAVMRCYRQANRRGYRVFSMQAHNECRSGPKAHTSYSMYGRRGGCSHWTGGNWANDVYIILKRAGPRRDALGMQSGKIPNGAIRASSKWDRNHGPERARLHIRKGRGKIGAWSARQNNRRQWLQIDLRRVSRITMIATQGRQDLDQWVEAYKLSYSLNGRRFMWYRKKFAANFDRNTVVTRVLKPVIHARFLRIHPRNWYRHISMRIELYGKRNRFVGNICNLPMSVGRCRALMWMWYYNKKKGRCIRFAYGGCGGNPNRFKTKKACERRCMRGPKPKPKRYVHHFKIVGCFKDTRRRALRKYLGHLRGKNAVEQCFRKVMKRGYRMFSMQGGGHCFTGANAQATYRRYGRSNRCRNYKGGNWANDVYSINLALPPKRWRRQPFGWLGCYRDRHVRALPVLLGRFRGRNAVKRCYHQANRRGYTVFSMQAHIECWSGPTAHNTYSMYGRRGGCSRWKGGGFANDVYIILKRAGKPARALGVQSGKVRVRDLSASSEWDRWHAAHRARLHIRRRGHWRGAWSAKHNNRRQWLQVDLVGPAGITMVATQGRQDYSQWVESYTLKYGRSPGRLRPYTVGRRLKVFAGNYDRHTVVVRRLRPPILARYIRFYPLSWHGHISMRVELYGKRLKNPGIKPPPRPPRFIYHYTIVGCFRDKRQRALKHFLGFIKKNPIQECYKRAYSRGYRMFSVQAGGHCFSGRNAHVTYAKYGPYDKCRNYVGGIWANNVYTINIVIPPRKWYKKPFGWIGCYRDMHVRALPVLLGRFRGRNAVQRCYHQANRRGYKVFSMQAHNECRSGPTAHVTYSVYGRRGGCSHWTGGNWANDVYVILSKAGRRRTPLGMENGRIRSQDIRASSQWDRNHAPYLARLHMKRGRRTIGAWSARHNRRGQWIQVDLRRRAVIRMIATQGRQDLNQWVTSYKIYYGNNGRNWVAYPKVFAGNYDRNTVVNRVFKRAIRARFIRIYPQSWHKHMSLRFELYGRRIGAPPRPKPKPKPPTIKVTTGVRVRDIGCYRDTGRRAVPQMDGRDVILKDYYRRRADAIKKCALVALRYGYKVFAVQHGGWCATGKNAHRTYSKYGKSNRCRNGKGGPWANTVYRVHGNCRQKTNDGHCCSFPFIYRGRRYNSCTKAGRRDRRPWCSLTPNYDRDRKLGFCGGRRVPVTRGLVAVSIGCFRDTGRRAIPPMEGKSKLLKGSYPRRRYAIQKCALVAARRGWRVFAVQNGGWCATSSRAHLTYRRYGPYNRCRKDGEGGPWANQVYSLRGSCRVRTTKGNCCVFPFVYRGKRYNSCTMTRHNRPWCAITPSYDVDRLWGNCPGRVAQPVKITPSITIEHLGCWRDTGRRAIPQLDGKFALIGGNYQRRRNAIRRCALVAARLGYRVFGVQNGGWCASGPRAQHTYRKYGKSNKCRNGKGGPWANDVYRVSGTCKQRTTKGECCVFPFVYKKRLYSSCTTVNSKRGAWCATTSNYDKDRKWGYCRGVRPPRPRPRPKGRFIKHYTIVGCFNDRHRRALKAKLGYFRGRNAVQRCYNEAVRRGFRMFAVQAGGHCFSGRNAHLTFRRYGPSRACRNFKGGRWANDVYSITKLIPPRRWKRKPFGFLGCYRDRHVRALPVLLGRFRGRNAVMRCYHQANRRGYKVFSMQAHNECRSGPKAHNSYSAWGRKGGCSRWTGGSWRNDVYVILKRAGRPFSPLGMENGFIPNNAIRASSKWDRNHGPENARLNRRRRGRKTGAWSSRGLNRNQWIQIDLRRTTLIKMISTQGRQDHSQWVTSYSVEYSQDGKVFRPYKRNKVFAGNFNRNTVVTHIFRPAIKARFIKVRPIRWYGHISMRLELYGKRIGGLPKPKPKPRPRPPPRITITTGVKVRDVGCYRDTGRRAVPQMDGRDVILKDYYRRRADAIKKCALVALRYGYKVFAVQHGGWCATGKNAHRTYAKYGKSNRCRNGKGGPWANTVYKVQGKCKQRTTDRHCCSFPFIYRGRRYNSCTKAGRRDRRPWCSLTPNYDRDRKLGFCSGKTRPKPRPKPQPRPRPSFNVHHYTIVGCFKDTRRRALRTYLGHFRGKNAVQRCYIAAVRQGFRMFAVQAGGHCFSGRSAHLTFGRYGPSNRCRHFTGGPWANDVYSISIVVPPRRKWGGRPYGSLGCYRDRHIRALPVLLGRFRGRGAVRRCYRKANRRGYRVFSMQAHNECRSGPTAHNSYSAWGLKRGCSRGTGGNWRNDVYVIHARVRIRGKPLGLANGRIRNRAITAKSRWDRNHGPERGRLNQRRGGGKVGAWCARRNNRNQWIQVDLGRRHIVTLISTQGRQDYDQWVTSYFVKYSNDGRKFREYKRHGRTKIFAGNFDRNTIITRSLRPAIRSRYIRIKPYTWVGHISLRFELYGKIDTSVRPPKPRPRPRPLPIVPGPSSIGVTADIAFLVDSSAKTGRSNFHLEKMFIKSITRRFTINRHHSHVGVVSYTSRPSLQMRFNQYNSVTEVNRAVDRMRFSGGRGRRVDLAVRSSYNWFFNRGPSFPFVRKILVVVVNGRQTGRSVFMFNRMRSLFARKNVKVFVVGVGGVDQRYLRPLTYRNRHVYVVRNFRSLVAKAGTIAKAIHSEMNIANELYQRMRLPKPEATQQQVTYFDKPLPNATVISTPVNGTHMA